MVVVSLVVGHRGVEPGGRRLLTSNVGCLSCFATKARLLFPPPEARLTKHQPENDVGDLHGEA